MRRIDREQQILIDKTNSKNQLVVCSVDAILWCSPTGINWQQHVNLKLANSFRRVRHPHSEFHNSISSNYFNLIKRTQKFERWIQINFACNFPTWPLTWLLTSSTVIWHFPVHCEFRTVGKASKTLVENTKGPRFISKEAISNHQFK